MKNDANFSMGCYCLNYFGWKNLMGLSTGDVFDFVMEISNRASFVYSNIWMMMICSDLMTNLMNSPIVAGILKTFSLVYGGDSFSNVLNETMNDDANAFGMVFANEIYPF